MIEILQKLNWPEIIAIISGIIYSILMMRENIWCWLFGIISSFAGFYMFYSAHLYGEALLHIFYVLVGIYGWYYWSSKKEKIRISNWPHHTHIFAIVSCVGLSFLLSHLLSSYTDGKNTIVDSGITIFSLLATYKETKKILTSWLYWIFLNVASSILCFNRGLYGYGWLMIAYTFLSVCGQWEWYRTYKKEQIIIGFEE